MLRSLVCDKSGAVAQSKVCFFRARNMFMFSNTKHNSPYLWRSLLPVKQVGIWNDHACTTSSSWGVELLFQAFSTFQA